MNRKYLDDFQSEEDEWESLVHHRNRPQSSEKTKRNKIKTQSDNVNVPRKRDRKKPDRFDY
ncbi:MAG: hypothetical protein EP297_06330 [Gammaproteobacteria bacterium]|nr:MAG: hypothetical protein EP297_06330 [Gammaproteobacteria bacterium]